ncbi:unnamed protein product [Withania somnifera]
MLLEENQIAFHSQDGMIVDDIKDYSHQIAEMIGLGSDTEFLQAGPSSGSTRERPSCSHRKQLPFPALSYDMVHCAPCGITWDSKDELSLIEIDRVLKPGGFFVLTSPATRQQVSSTSAKKGSRSTPLEEFTKKLCCHNQLQSTRLRKMIILFFGVHPDNYFEYSEFWKSARPGDDDPLPPYNMVRNVLDMNAHYGGLNAALLEARESVWVMNVVPLGVYNTLPLILDRGFAGILHNWGEPFPTYPRTYDLPHGNGLLSHLDSQGCSTFEVLVELDRILRPEGWIILSDKVGPIERVRMVATQMHWEARVIDLQDGSDQRLLICQKSFVRK